MEGKMKKELRYQPLSAEIIHLDSSDVITSSIGEDTGENDGEWTAFIGSKSKSTGIWE